MSRARAPGRLSRRGFLAAMLAAPAAAAVAGCSRTPGALPAPPSPASQPPPGPEAAAASVAAIRDPDLAVLRDIELGDGVEPVTVFHASRAN